MFAGVSGQGVHDDRGFWGCFWGGVLCCCYPCFWWHERSVKAANKRYLAEKAASADAAANATGMV